MGGRGAWSSLMPSSTEAEFQKNILGVAIPETLKQALGAKGSSLSIEAAYKGANPYFSRSFAEYSMNCQRSVIAYEMRRRGYKVTALPTYEGDTLPYRIANNAFWQGAFQKAKPVNISATRRKKVKANIENEMKKWGNGSRAVIGVRWNGNHGGHVFNVENKNGKMVYIDAQVGKRVSIREYLRYSRPSDVRIVRTDNLRPSDRMKKSVTVER